MRRYPPRRECVCDGSARGDSLRVPPTIGVSLGVSLLDLISSRHERTVRRRLLPIPARHNALVPVVERADWVTLSRDRTRIQLFERKLYRCSMESNNGYHRSRWRDDTLRELVEFRIDENLEAPRQLHQRRTARELEIFDRSVPRF